MAFRTSGVKKGDGASSTTLKRHQRELPSKQYLLISALDRALTLIQVNFKTALGNMHCRNEMTYNVTKFIGKYLNLDVAWFVNKFLD